MDFRNKTSTKMMLPPKATPANINKNDSRNENQSRNKNFGSVNVMR
jgi:hypothetical protein